MYKKKKKETCPNVYQVMKWSGTKLVLAINEIREKDRRTILKANLGAILTNTKLPIKVKQDILEELSVEFVISNV